MNHQFFCKHIVNVTVAKFKCTMKHLFFISWFMDQLTQYLIFEKTELLYIFIRSYFNMKHLFIVLKENTMINQIGCTLNKLLAFMLLLN